MAYGGVMSLETQVWVPSKEHRCAICHVCLCLVVHAEFSSLAVGWIEAMATRRFHAWWICDFLERQHSKKLVLAVTWTLFLSPRGDCCPNWRCLHYHLWQIYGEDEEYPRLQSPPHCNTLHPSVCPSQFL